MDHCFLVFESDPILARTLKRTLARYAAVRHERTAGQARRALDETGRWGALFFNAGLPSGDGLDLLQYARDIGCASPAVVIATAFHPAALHRAFELRSHYVLDLIEPGSLEGFARGCISDDRRARRKCRRAICIPADPPCTSSWEHTLRTWTDRYELTRAEATILRSAASGAAHKEMTGARGISDNTLKKQVRGLLRKTGDSSLSATALRLLRECSVRRMRAQSIWGHEGTGIESGAPECFGRTCVRIGGPNARLG